MANQQKDEFLRGAGTNLYTYLIPNTKFNPSRRQNYHILEHSTEDIHDLRIEKYFFNNTLKHQQDGKRLVYFIRSRKINTNCDMFFEVVITKRLISWIYKGIPLIKTFSFFKWAKYLNKDFTKEEIHVVDKPVRKKITSQKYEATMRFDSSFFKNIYMYLEK